MFRRDSTSRRLAVLLSLAFQQLASAQSCYVPNGQLPLDPQGACGSSDGAACCQLGWQCLSNGLCFFPPQNWYSRAGCTDQTWKSDACLDYCTTDNGSSGGNQAVNKCSNGKYCCNADRLHGDCCTKSDTKFFQLPEGSVIASITSVKATSAPASTSKASSTKSTTTSSSSSTNDTNDPQTTSQKQTSSTITSTITTGNGGVSTIIMTTQVTSQIIFSPTTSAEGSTDGSDSSTSTSSKTSVIVGAAVGVPVGLALLGAMAFLLLRRHRRNQAPNPTKDVDWPPPAEETSQFDATGFYAGKPPVGGAAEIDGRQKRPLSEMDGTPTRHPHSPTATSALGHSASNSWSTVPPIYTSGPLHHMPETPDEVGRTPTVDATGGLSPIASPVFPAQYGGYGGGGANATPGGRYIPYRPPGGPTAPVELPTD